MGLRLASLLCVLLLVAACAERAPRRTGWGQRSWVDAGSLGLQQVEGILKRVDVQGGSIVLERGGQELHLQALPETSVFVRGAVAPLASLEVGEEVRASFSEVGSQKVVRWIEIPREELPAHMREQGDPLEPPPAPAPPPASH